MQYFKYYATCNVKTEIYIERGRERILCNFLSSEQAQLLHKFRVLKENLFSKNKKNNCSTEIISL